MILALAGRRIDSANEPHPQFPLAAVTTVRQRVVEAFEELRATGLVCAAACGADLLAIDIAEQRRIPTHIVLPFPPAEFKHRSVTDRPGDWGALFEYHLGEAERNRTLHVLALPDDGKAYLRTNEAILDDALGFAGGVPDGVRAVIVWRGPLQGRTDYTAHFRDAAVERGIRVVEISTSMS